MPAFFVKTLLETLCATVLLRKLGESVRPANIRTLCCHRIYIYFESSRKNYSDSFSQRKNSLLLNLSEIPYPLISFLL